MIFFEVSLPPTISTKGHKYTGLKGWPTINLSGNFISFCSSVGIKPEVEEEIYCRGFPSNVEKTFVNSFNLCPPEDRPGLTKAYAQRLNCDRYVRLANRVLLEHFPSSCSEQEQNQYFEWIHNRLFSYPTEGYEPKWDTIYTCLSQIEALKKKYPNKLERIEEIRLFYVRIGSVAGLDLHNVFGH